LDPEDIRGGTILQGGQRQILEIILDFLKKDPQQFYYTPVVACPPKPQHEIREMVPLPAKGEIQKCRARVMKEIDIIRCLIPKQTPNLVNEVGRLFEAPIPGTHVEYPIPTILTYSLHDLKKMPGEHQAAMWHEVASHINTALHLADALTIRG